MKSFTYHFFHRAEIFPFLVSLLCSLLMMIYCASTVEDSPFYKSAGSKPANLSAWIPGVCEVIHPRVMAEARALRCFQNLSQLCSQWLRIPQRVTWHTFTDSKYLCSLRACPSFLGTQGGSFPMQSCPLARTPGSGVGETTCCSPAIKGCFVFESS